MFLVRLIYASKVAPRIGPEDIESILACARRHNAKLGVTGLLCFSQDYFLQCLEGARSQVSTVYQTILRDPRHDGIVLLDYKEIVKREFAQWSMGYIPTTALMKQTVLQYGGSDEFDPFKMSGESAQAFLQNAKSLHTFQAKPNTSKVA
ncbi:BLUF domain-containing protein [Kaarinaea lacus]